MEEDYSDSMVEKWHKVIKEVVEKTDKKILGEKSLLFYTDVNYTTTIS